MKRVHYRDLDVHPEEGDACSLRGRPFTGVAYAAWFNATPKAEWTLRDGYLWGPQRTWGSDGGPGRAWYSVRGLAHGVYRQWALRPGRLLVLAVVRYGVTVRERKWDEEGNVILDYTMPEEGRAAEELRKLEAEFRDTFEAEAVPAEFREVAEGEWDGVAPTRADV